MHKLLFVSLGNIADAFVATSLVKKLSSQFDVECITNENGGELFDYCDCSNSLLSRFEPSTKYEMVINSTPGVLGSSLLECVDSKKKLGYGFKNGEMVFYNEGAERHYRTMYAKHESSSNAFQLLFALANLSWQGEGYGIKYYPKNKCRKALTGVAIKDHDLRVQINDNLKLEKSRLWKVPFKQNPLRMLDELNRCKRVVTDDVAMVHAACSLRKKVEYISTTPVPYKLEMFGSGHMHDYGRLNAT